MNNRKLKWIVLSLFVVVLLGSLLNAETQRGTPKPSIPYTHVVSYETQYYLHGPQQAMPPQGKFRPGTKVIIIQDMGSYVRVKSDNGIEAAVSAESLRKIQ
ncbi:MAG: hypothetical protein COV45_06640 [Deltaproteobacteria bacterium CG11_big_fil_rev_8_21_14_0_20_47_16]|nr:MAG: hypothetical protein COV45_06640 [Deltaproteobacteria bacterium CG11_big_fil_rev_8_21_14_0_20_47_16]